MPKATDKSFTDKLVGIWKGKSAKFEVPRFGDGFILHHYASQVEYKTAGWLEKNKDPLNDNVTRLLANSSDKFISQLYADFLVEEDDLATARRVVSTVKKGK
jgi:myosin protein heavy chain